MKSFASDEKPIDIEELYKLKCLNDKKCLTLSNKKVHIIKDNSINEWFIPNNLSDLFNLLTEYQTSSYRLVGGNTGTGVYKNDGPFDVFIDIKNVPDLHQVTKATSLLTVGSSVQLKNLIDVMNEFSSTSGFEYLSEISHHLSKIANIPVRNAASWSGNLMLKYNHNEFPSDVFICFETIGALLTLKGPDILTPPIICSPSEFLSLSTLNGKLLFSVSFVPFDKNTTLVKTYKIMPRSQNAHAYVSIVIFFL
jgi:xanthine dehydrogenase/oxidase